MACGALPRTPPKELFEKSSLGILKSFPKMHNRVCGQWFCMHKIAVCRLYFFFCTLYPWLELNFLQTTVTFAKIVSMSCGVTAGFADNRKVCKYRFCITRCNCKFYERPCSLRKFFAQMQGLNVPRASVKCAEISSDRYMKKIRRNSVFFQKSVKEGVYKTLFLCYTTIIGYLYGEVGFVMSTAPENAREEV